MKALRKLLFEEILQSCSIKLSKTLRNDNLREFAWFNGKFAYLEKQ